MWNLITFAVSIKSCKNLFDLKFSIRGTLAEVQSVDSTLNSWMLYIFQLQSIVLT